MKEKTIKKDPFPVSKFPELVAAIIQDEQGRILVSQRALDSKVYPGKWQIPGGKVEPGEECLAALKREVKEETDLEITAINDLLIKWFNVSIYQVETAGEPKVMEPSKVNTGWVYLGIAELQKKDLTPALAELLKQFN